MCIRDSGTLPCWGLCRVCALPQDQRGPAGPRLRLTPARTQQWTADLPLPTHLPDSLTTAPVPP
eukprot:5902633-Prorocentrum_lima.AAC.1